MEKPKEEFFVGNQAEDEELWFFCKKVAETIGAKEITPERVKKDYSNF
jgi:hypothetical protein